MMKWIKGLILDHYTESPAKVQFAILNNRFSRIPSYPGLRIFQNGVTNLSNTTAGEWRDIQKVEQICKLMWNSINILQ